MTIKWDPEEQIYMTMNSKRLILFVLLAMVSRGDAIPSLNLDKVWYSTMESNLVSEVNAQTGKAVESIYSLGYLNSTSAIPLLLDKISFTEHSIHYFIDNDGTRMSLGQAERIPGWVYPALVSLETLKPDLNEYLSRISAQTNNSLEVDLLSVSAYSVHGSNFVSRIPDLIVLDSNRWSYVQKHLQWKSESFTKPIHFGYPSGLASTNVIASYEAIQTNLLALATSACAEQNATNLLDVVSTYRFIHAPIPEAVSTNAFFQATVGDN